MMTRSVLNGFKKHSEWEKERLFSPFAYAQTTVRVRPNARHHLEHKESVQTI